MWKMAARAGSLNKRRQARSQARMNTTSQTGNLSISLVAILNLELSIGIIASSTGASGWQHSCKAPDKPDISYRGFL